MNSTFVRLLNLAGGVLLSVLASAATAAAAPITFGFTGGFQTFTAPATGLYSILAAGAQGGSGGTLGSSPGGLGARAGGDFTLTAGEVLQIAVGGAGGDVNGAVGGGGGGATRSP